MRKLLFAVALAAMIGSVVVGDPAMADDSSYCPHASSTRLLTATVVGYEHRVWVYQPNPNEVAICVRPSLSFEFLVRVRTPSGGLVPSVVPTTADTGSCLTVVDIQDPVDLPAVNAGVGSLQGFDATYVCVHVLGVKLRVSKAAWTPAVPTVEVWRDGYTWHAFVVCDARTPSGGPAYDDCFTNPERVL